MMQQTLDELITGGRSSGASDLHLAANEPPVYRIDGSLMRWKTDALSADDVDILAHEIAQRANYELTDGDADFAFADALGQRQRVNVYRQQGSRAVAIRFLRDDIPTVEELGLPPILNRIADAVRGLILVTGPTGSGKSTTLAAMIDHINTSRKLHIITMEDPIEYVHENKQCVISQREIGSDATGFADSIRSAMRQDPDIILVGEMRDPETIAAALTAAETGHLVLSTLHTTGASKTIDRIIDSFEPYQQQQVRTQLATSLKAVVSQQLLPKAMGGRVAVHEIMLINDAVANMIREGKVFQIASALQTGAKTGMVNMDASLAALVRSGTITQDTAHEFCISPDELRRYIGAGWM